MLSICSVDVWYGYLIVIVIAIIRKQEYIINDYHGPQIFGSTKRHPPQMGRVRLGLEKGGSLRISLSPKKWQRGKALKSRSIWFPCKYRPLFQERWTNSIAGTCGLAMWLFAVNRYWDHFHVKRNKLQSTNIFLGKSIRMNSDLLYVHTDMYGNSMR